MKEILGAFKGMLNMAELMGEVTEVVMYSNGFAKIVVATEEGEMTMTLNLKKENEYNG